MPGKCRPSLRKKTLDNVMRSNLSQTDKDCIKAVFERYEKVVCIAGEPTIEAEPVVHGEWIFGTANHREYMKCSWCLHSQTPTGVFVYCPNCGAKMDRGEL